MSKSNKGFTLIELLVALAIFSSILALALTAFNQGVVSWERALRVIDKEKYLLRRESWFYPLFEQSIAAEYVYPDGKRGNYFDATAREMQFLSSVPILTGPGRVAAVNLQIFNDNNGVALRYRQKFSSDIQRGIRWSDEQWFTLVSGMENIEFVYLAGIHKPALGSVRHMVDAMKQYYRDKPEWLDHFSGRWEESLPHRVAIIMKDKSGKKTEWDFPVTYVNSALSPLITADDS